MMSKTEKAARWTLAMGVCAVMSAADAVVFLAGVSGLVGYITASVFWTLAVLFACSIPVIRYRSTVEDYRDRL
jgi:hypothetical protein